MVPRTAAQERAFLTRHDNKLGLYRSARPFPDDRLWITDARWILPAGLFDGAAKDWGLSCGPYSKDEGWFWVDGKAATRDRDFGESTAGMVATYLDAATYTTRLDPVTVPVLNFPARWPRPGTVDGQLDAGFVRRDGRQTVPRLATLATKDDLVVVDAETLDVAELTRTVALPYGVRYADVEWRQHKGRTDDAPPSMQAPNLQAIALTAKREVERGGHKADDGIGWVPKRWEAEPGRHVLAVVMPMRPPETKDGPR
jgi:hypothetical protein